jgi:dihydroorotate dehydrogenase electron transfer subunit
MMMKEQTLHPRIHSAELVYNRAVAPGVFRMRVRCPAASRQALPGQFIMLRVCGPAAAPLLRRPFSLCGADGETLEILYRVAGIGTSIMTTWKAPQAIDFIGPLGRGFAVSVGLETAYVVAGGIGVAPLLFLLQRLGEQHTGCGISLFMGGKTADETGVLDAFKPLPGRSFIATDDGSAGFHGLVTDLFSAHREKLPEHDRHRAGLFCCGPRAMARVMTAMAERFGMHCQVSLEERMACGIGACLGCAVKTRSRAGSDAESGGTFSYQRVCAEGPVFDARELVWDEE